MVRNNYSSAVVRNPDTGQLETVCLDTGEVISTGTLGDLSAYKFNFDMAALICQKIRQGATLNDISDDPKLPSLQVIHHWRRSNASFDEEIKIARKDRAEYYHDKVIQLANEISERDEVPVAKFKTDQYKWAAEKGDPSSYGNKIEHTGTAGPAKVIIVTGIKKPKIVEDIEVAKYEEVQDTRPCDKEDDSSDGGEVLEYSSGEDDKDERPEDSK